MSELEGLRVVVTGASRGLGLEFTRQYAAGGHEVFALARRPSAGPLAELARERDYVHAIACDVAEEDSRRAALAAIEERTSAVDLWINNAGVAGATGSRFGELDLDDIRSVFDVNVVAPIRMSELGLPLLRAGRNPRIAHVTSRMGSIADNESGGWWAYRMSKAALNMACKNMMLELRPDVATMVLHPGWVATDMGGGGAPLSAEESVAGMRDVIARLDASRSGTFFDYSGEELPW